MAQHNTPAQNPQRQPDKGRTGDQAHDPKSAKPKQDHPESTDRGRDRNPGDAKRDEKGAMGDRSTGNRGMHETEPKGQRLVGQNDANEGEDETTAQGGSHMKSPKTH